MNPDTKSTEPHTYKASEFLRSWHKLTELLPKLNSCQFQALTQLEPSEWAAIQQAVMTLSALSQQQWEQLLFPALAIAPYRSQMSFPIGSLTALEFSLHVPAEQVARCGLFTSRRD